MHYLTTSRSHKSQSDAQSVAADRPEGTLPYFEIRGRVTDAQAMAQDLRVYFGPRGLRGPRVKALQVDGERVRAAQFMGRLRAVLFIPEDTRLVAEGPGVRRRAMDIALCQIDRHYFDSLLQYQKILRARNALLKRLRKSLSTFDSARVEAETHFWNRELVSRGADIMFARVQWLRLLEDTARAHHSRMTGNGEHLELIYRPSVRFPDEDVLPGLAARTRAEWEARFGARIEETLEGDFAQTVTASGPHRDDVLFRVNGLPLGEIGSRGQQRTAALAYRLAEVEGIRTRCQAYPLLLLDDVMSELDATRRGTVVETIRTLDQVIITTTDWSHYPSAFRDRAACWKVRDGALKPI